MKLIVGLGNPDKEYLNTYHNLGFMAVDRCAEILNVQFSKQKCKALIAETHVDGNKVILAKPLTYMNLSGESVRELVSLYKIDLSDIVIVYDDYDLAKGTIRIRENGSSGTHNGMRNIVKELGCTDFARIRIGFKPSIQPASLIDFVLSEIKVEDKETFESAIIKVAKACEDFAKGKKVKDLIAQYSGKPKQ